jgi:DNA-binding PadR family transcriptional regulator
LERFGKDRDPRDAFTKDLDLPRGRERRPVRERERVYEIDGAESRALATIGAFRVIPEGDLHDIRDDAQNSRRSFKHLEKEGLIRTSPLSSDDRAVTLTDRGRELLEANRYERDDRIRIDAKRQALDALDAARRSTAHNGDGNGDGADQTEIPAIVEVSDDLTSQSRHSLLLQGSPPSAKLLIPLERRDVRVVEGARLEIDSARAC